MAAAQRMGGARGERGQSRERPSDRRANARRGTRRARMRGRGAMDASAQRSAVTKRDVEWARLTVFAATKAIAVAGEPLVEPIGELPYERDLEDPRNEAALWKDVEQLLDSRRALPG